MALLHGLNRVNQLRKCGWQIHVAHLDHHLPHNSDAMMSFVRQTAEKLSLPFAMDVVDVPAASRQSGESIEEAGRKIRYAFLERAARKTGALVVAVGHHADDQAETVLHRILRGTGLRGLAGMPDTRPIHIGSEIRLVRPLMDTRRADLVDYLRKRCLTFMHDVTNDDVLAATRNRIRHDVLPAIAESINPDAVSAITRLAAQSRHAGDAINFLAQDALDKITIANSQADLCLDAEALRMLPRAIQTEVVVIAIDQAGMGMKGISLERIEAVAAAAAGEGRLRRIELPGGGLVERRGRRLLFHHPPTSETHLAPAEATKGRHQ